MKIDYENLTEITVKNQKELDEIPLDFKGRIYIEFGKPWDRAIVKNKYYRSVVARENSSVEARENSSVVACGNSSVVARENSSVEARENSSVVACGNSSVVARDNSSVEAWGNVQIVDRQDKEKYSTGKIKILGNARIVYMPRNIEEFMNFYGIEHTKTKAIFYKAVRKEKDGTYHSDYNSDFTYEIGKVKTERCDDDIEEDCSYGINISHRDWVLSFGKNWRDLAILKVETKIADIVMPINTDGKVRTSKVKVLEEVPLEECGVFGKIIAKRGQVNG